MNGLIMDYQLNISAILRRAESLFGEKEIVTRLPDKSFHRYTYADFAARARRLASALQGLGLKDGARVATLAWNHYQHLEIYFGVPISGNVVHTLNLRLSPGDLAYIANHAGDRVLLVDESLMPLCEAFMDQVEFEHVIKIGPEYEELLASGDPRLGLPGRRRALRRGHVLHERHDGAAEGRPLLAPRDRDPLARRRRSPGRWGSAERDTVLPVVPMFHANAWGFPFTCTMVGAKQVFPGPHLDPESLLDAFVQEGVTVTGGVPTIWLGILGMLDADPQRYDLSRLRSMIVGGSAAPEVDDRGLPEAARPPRPARVGDDRDGAARRRSPG